MSGAVAPIDARPVASRVLERALHTVGPEGIADVESRLSAAVEVRDELERQVESSAVARGRDTQFPVRLCTTDCSFRTSGGPGCTLYQNFATEGRNIDGQQCERDITILRETQDIFKDGDEEKIRELAGRFTGAVILQIQSMFTRIIAEGCCTEDAVFDAKGAPVFTEELLRDQFGEVIFERDGPRRGQPRVLRRLITRKREHPLFPRLLSFLKETRLIDLSQFELTPKSGASTAPTDGMILAGDKSKVTIEEVRNELTLKLTEVRRNLEVAAGKRAGDKTFQRMRERVGAAESDG